MNFAPTAQFQSPRLPTGRHETTRLFGGPPARTHSPLQSPNASPQSAKARKEPAVAASALKDFLKTHSAVSLIDGRYERLLAFLYAHGERALNEQLMQDFGRDLNSGSSKAKSKIQMDPREYELRAHQITMQLTGFYHDNNVFDRPADVIRKTAEWGVRHGLAALNAKLAAKYGDDLESHAQRLASKLEPSLRSYYARVKPEILERGLGPLLAWATNNGEDALNDLLLQRYGEDLKGRRRPGPPQYDAPVQFQKQESQQQDHQGARKGAPLVPARPRLHQFMQAVGLNAPNDWRAKDIRAVQIGAFLATHDPVRLGDVALLESLIYVCRNKTEEEVDDLLREMYGSDLHESRLRSVSSFTADEISVAGTLPPVSDMVVHIMSNEGRADSIYAPIPEEGAQDVLDVTDPLYTRLQRERGLIEPKF